MSDANQKLDQTIYSRLTLTPMQTEAIFFQTANTYFNHDPGYNLCDTNMEGPGQLISGKKFQVTGIDLHLTYPSLQVLHHLMSYGYFIFRIVNRDYLHQPIHLMDNHCSFLRRNFTIPGPIEMWQHFMVHFHLLKGYPKPIEMTFELNGVLLRPWY